MPRQHKTTTLASDLDGIAAAVVAFASAIKNLTIYPANHPRVAARAAEFAAMFAGLGLDRLELVLHGDHFAIAGGPLPEEHMALDWLAQRCRETGLRGIEIEQGCTSDDVLRFASARSACRPGSGQNLADGWSEDAARVRPVALVVADSHAAGSRRRPGSSRRRRRERRRSPRAAPAAGNSCTRSLHGPKCRI